MSIENAPHCEESPHRFINVFLLAMLNLAIMVSLRSLPVVAQYGLGSLFFYVIAAIGFLFPAALVSAELATGWSRTGGVYIWVREAFGPKWGFFAIWMQWAHNVTWFPAILSFVATTLAYTFNPSLAENKLYILAVVLGSFWLMTFLNYFGLKISSWFSVWCVILGTIIPGALILGFGLFWILGNNPLSLTFSLSALVPDLKSWDNIVFLAGMFLAFGGLEVSAVHAREVKNPQKDFPRAVLIASIIAFFLLVLGALSIAIIVPPKEISLIAGLMEAFQRFFHYFHLDFLLPVMAILIVFGAVGEINAWIIGPVRGLFATSKHGDLPKFLEKQNKKNIPVNILLMQAIIVTIASFVILFMPTTSSSFWILTALAIQIYLVMYILMFLAAIRLRYTHPHVERAYRIPHKHHGMWFVASLGILSSLFAFGISFVPPVQLHIKNLFFYESFLILGLLLMSAIPFVIYKLEKNRKKALTEQSQL